MSLKGCVWGTGGLDNEVLCIGVLNGLLKVYVCEGQGPVMRSFVR